MKNALWSLVVVLSVLCSSASAQLKMPAKQITVDSSATNAAFVNGSSSTTLQQVVEFYDPKIRRVWDVTQLVTTNASNSRIGLAGVLYADSSGATVSNAPLSVLGSLSVTGAATLAQATFSSISTTGTLSSGNASVGTLTATGATTVAAGGLAVTAGGVTVTAGGVAVTAGGVAVTAGDVMAAASAVTAGRFSTTGTTATAGLTATGAGSFGSLSTTGTLAGGVSTLGATTVGNLTTTGAVTSVGSTVGGTLTANAASITNLTVLAGTTVGNLSTTGAVSAGSLALTGGLTTTGAVSAGAVTVASLSTTGAVSVGTLSATASSLAIGAVTSTGTVSAATIVCTNLVSSNSATFYGGPFVYNPTTVSLGNGDTLTTFAGMLLLRSSGSSASTILTNTVGSPTVANGQSMLVGGVGATNILLQSGSSLTISGTYTNDALGFEVSPTNVAHLISINNKWHVIGASK